MYCARSSARLTYGGYLLGSYSHLSCLARGFSLSAALDVVEDPERRGSEGARSVWSNPAFVELRKVETPFRRLEGAMSGAGVVVEDPA